MERQGSGSAQGRGQFMSGSSRAQLSGEVTWRSGDSRGGLSSSHWGLSGEEGWQRIATAWTGHRLSAFWSDVLIRGVGGVIALVVGGKNWGGRGARACLPRWSRGHSGSRCRQSRRIRAVAVSARYLFSHDDPHTAWCTCVATACAQVGAGGGRNLPQTLRYLGALLAFPVGPTALAGTGGFPRPASASVQLPYQRSPPFSSIHIASALSPPAIGPFDQLLLAFVHRKALSDSCDTARSIAVVNIIDNPTLAASEAEQRRASSARSVLLQSHGHNRSRFPGFPETAAMTAPPHVGIVGAGVIGLCTALHLADAKHPVTVVARDLPGDENTNWASPWAGAAFIPLPDGPGIDLMRESFKFYWALAHRDPSAGVQTINVTEYVDSQEDDDNIWYKTMVPHYRKLKPAELPEGVKLGFTYTSLALCPPVLLKWYEAQLLARGVKFIRATVSSLDDARRITGADLIVNASGLGAKQLAHDDAVEPIRGQTMFVKSDFNRIVHRWGSEYTYIIPRMYTGGVILGGVAQHGNVSTAINRDTKEDILRRVNHLTGGEFKTLDLDKVEKDIVGFRPGRIGEFRLEKEGSTIHAYGFGHAGYVWSGGAAKKIQEITAQVGKSKL